MIGENLSIDLEAKDLNKEIQDKLEKLIKLSDMGKKPIIGSVDNLKLSKDMEFLSPKNIEKIKKGLNNFEVISVESRSVIVPFGQDLNDRTISLLTQMVKAAPQLFIIRQKIEQSKANEFTQNYAVNEDFDNLALLKNANKNTIVVARTDEGMKALYFKKFDEENGRVTGKDEEDKEFTVSINSILNIKEKE